MAAASKKHGGWENRPVSGTEVLVQELSRHGDSGGFYHAFMIGRRATLRPIRVDAPRP